MISQQILGGFVLFLLILGTASLLVSLTVNGTSGAKGIPGPTGPDGPLFAGILAVADGGTSASLTLNPNKIIVSTIAAFQEGTSSIGPTFDSLQSTQKRITFGNPLSQTLVQFDQSGIVYLNDSNTSNSYLVLTDGDQKINEETMFGDLLDLQSLETYGGVGVQGSTQINGGLVQTEGKQIQLINTSSAGNFSYLQLNNAIRNSFLKQQSTGLFKLESTSHLFMVENKNAFEVSTNGTIDFYKSENQTLFGTNVSLSVEPSNKNVIYGLGNGIISSDVLLTQGNQTVPGIKTFSNLEPIQNIQLTTNQLLLGNGTQKVTVNSSPKASDLVVTIPAAIPTSSFVLTEGNQTINGLKTFSASIANLTNVIVSPLSNQIEMGTGQTVTINAVPTSTSLIQTLPDVGVNSNFLMTEGTQVLPTAIKTFTNAKFIVFQTNNIVIPGVLASLSGAIQLGFPNVTTVQLASGFATGTNYSLDTTIPGPCAFVMSFTSSPGTPTTVGGTKKFADDCTVGTSLIVNTAIVQGVISTGAPRTYTMITTSLQTIPNGTITVIWTSGSGTNWSTKTFPLTILTVDITGFYIVEYQIDVVAIGAGTGVVDAWIEKDGGGPSQMGRQSMFIDQSDPGILSGACIIQVTNVATQGIFIQTAQQTNSLGNNINITSSYCKVTYLSPL
jgi:hypothetical protein